MSTLWYPHAIQRQQPDNGTFTGGPGKGLLHSTEAQFGNKATFVPGTYSHFEVVAHIPTQTVEVYQYYPMNQPSRALVDGGDPVRTNRDGVIQIELGFQAARVATVPSWFWNGLSPLLRWVEDTAHLNPADWAKFIGYPNSYGANNGVRFTDQQWDGFNGWCGHMHVPDGNTHGDPGAIPVNLLKRASAIIVPKYYVIKDGDNVKSIADGHHLTVLKLWRLNYPFKVGQRLRVR